jgi:hypothetical protein
MTTPKYIGELSRQLSERLLGCGSPEEVERRIRRRANEIDLARFRAERIAAGGTEAWAMRLVVDALNEARAGGGR